MLDYPKQVSTVLFVGTCNWRCGYCQNLELLKMKDLDFDNIILPKLISRKSIINHVIISGGECLYDPSLEYYIFKLKDLGFKVGIHTNGYNFEKLEKVIDNINFVGMDIKTSFNKYNDLTNSNVKTENILKSLKIIYDNNVYYDVRTTIVPKWVDFEDLNEICSILYSIGFSEYNIQKYNPIREDEYNFSNEELIKLKEVLSEFWDNKIKIKLRGLV